MSLASQRTSTLNPNAPLFIPAAVRQVEDFSPEWWQLVKTSTWFHDYWLSRQQHRNNGFFLNTTNDCDIVDMLPDSIDTDEDMLSMEAQYEQLLNSFSMEAENSIGLPGYKQMPVNGLETDTETLLRSLSLPKLTHGSQAEMITYPEKPVKSFSPQIRSHLIQQPQLAERN